MQDADDRLPLQNQQVNSALPSGTALSTSACCHETIRSAAMIPRRNDFIFPSSLDFVVRWRKNITENICATLAFASRLGDSAPFWQIFGCGSPPIRNMHRSALMCFDYNRYELYSKCLIKIALTWLYPLKDGTFFRDPLPLEKRLVRRSSHFPSSQVFVFHRTIHVQTLALVSMEWTECTT